MPLELIAERPGHAVLREYEDPPLAAGEVRATTQFSAVKHGTEFRDFRLAVQMAKLSGARWVAASDPIERRRAAAARHSADVVFDPAEVDVGLAIKQMTGSLGVDVSIETSRSHAALYDALEVVALLEEGRLQAEDLVDPIVPIAAPPKPTWS